jgi:hypothetical protein
MTFSNSQNSINFCVSTGEEESDDARYAFLEINVSPTHIGEHGFLFSFSGERRNDDMSIYTFEGNILLNGQKKNNAIKMLRLMADFLNGNP